MLTSAADAKKGPWQYLDGDAPLVMRVDPGKLESLVDLLASQSVVAQLAVSTIKKEASTLLGADLLSANGRRTLGIGAGPVYLQLGAVDHDKAFSAYEALRTAKSWQPSVLRKVPKTFWRSRAVFTKVKATRVRRAVATLSRRSKVLTSVIPSNGKRLAMLLGTRPDNAANVVATLRKYGVLSLGWVDGLDAFVVIRLRPGVAIVEVAAPYAGVPLVWDRDRNKLLAAFRLKTRSRRDKPTAALVPSAFVKRSLASGGVRAVVFPGALFGFFASAANNQHLLEHPGHAATLSARKIWATSQPIPCKGIKEALVGSPLGPLAISLQASTDELEAVLRWHAKKAFTLHKILVSSEDPLAHVFDREAGLSAVSYLESLKGLRTLPRPALLRYSAPATRRALRRCTSGAFTTLTAFAWPLLAGQFLDDLAGISPEAMAIVDGLRNVSIAVKSPSLDYRNLEIAGEVSMASATEATIHKLLDDVFGSRQTQNKLITWGAGALRPYQRGSSGPAIFGASMGKGLRKWFLDKAQPKPAVGALLRARVDTTRSNALLATVGGVPAALSTIAGLFDTVDIELTLRPDALQLTLNLKDNEKN
jgi:hypothetical protein